ncbi:MAG TPA: hypothetical protein VN345_04670 [Blastocatellia bacterium]|nr:hypothetical protein [Blastocatellia bacterium]
MVDVKQAVKAAREYLSQLYDTGPLRDIFLEEVELSYDEKHWYVTIGFSRPIAPKDPILSSIDALSRQSFERVYKLFEVDSATGQVRAMKIRAA